MRKTITIGEEVDLVIDKLQKLKAEALKSESPPLPQTERPSLVRAENICEGNIHDLLKSEILMPKSAFPEIRDICLICGFIPDSDLMLNATALQVLRDSKELGERNSVREKKIAVSVDFEMSKFYDEWEVIYGQELLTALKPGGDIEKKHQLFSHFLHQGLEVSLMLRDEIIQEMDNAD